jgi:hypothetical protein
MRTLANRLGNTEGAEIAEAALVLPVVFLFLLGIVWFGRAFNIYSTIQQAAQQGAITAARPTCATCPTANTFPSDTTVTNTIFAVLEASSLDPTQIPVNSKPPAPLPCVIPPVPCTTPSNISVCRQVLLNASVGANQPPICGTLISFQYPFKFYLPFTSLNLSRIVLTAQAQSRMEN